MKKSLFIFLLIFSKTVFSQNGWAAYLGGVSGTFLTGPETCLAIDKNGNKWVGFTSSLASSPAAVARFDKTTGFWSYYNTANTPVIPNNRVNTIACDTSGSVWIGTNAGLVKFDGSSWTCYTTANGLPSDNILSLECVNNMLYIGTNAGLTRYNGAVFTNYNVGNSLLSNDTITCIKAQTPNQIWLGHYNRIIEFNINPTFTFSSFTIHQIPFTTGKVNCIYLDNLGKKWLGTSSKGVIEYDNVNFTQTTTTYSDIIGAYTPSLTCYDIAKGPNNGPVFYTTCIAYPTPSGNSSVCLLELLPNKEYKVYYVPDNNYTIGDFLENDASGELFISNKTLVHLGSFLKFMFSFKEWSYSTYNQGPGFGVTNKNFRFLDINRVKAGIANRGDMFWDIAQSGYASYEVPKGSKAHSQFCKTLWIGGLDASNQLHIAAQGYRQTGCEFWPGPLDTTNATCDSATFANFDKIWKVSYTDINAFITNFQNGNIANNTYTPTIDIITWPAKGNGNLSRNLAPFVDVNNNGIYDPLTGGDYPRIKGDQTLYFIFNDAYTYHSDTWGAKLGFEIHCMAYAYGCPNFLNGKNELAYTTFYNYKIYNRSNNNYHNLKIGLYDDVDLGNYQDDYIACDVANNLGFSYNGDGYDETFSGVNGYGNYPPACGSRILKGPIAPLNDGKDNNNDGIIDEPNEECLMNQFTYYNSQLVPFPASYPPKTAYQYFNYIDAKWRDSTSYTCGGNAYGGTTPTAFVYPWVSYPGNPCALWGDNVNPKGDRRHIMAMGPFNLNAGQSTEFEFAQLWGVDSSSTGNILGSINKLISNAQLVNTFYKSGVQSTCLPNMAIGINEITDDLIKAIVFPNPASQTISIDIPNNESAEIQITDVIGKIMFIQHYPQLKNQPVDVRELKSGLYIIKIRQQQASLNLKFIKE